MLTQGRGGSGSRRAAPGREMFDENAPHQPVAGPVGVGSGCWWSELLGLIAFPLAFVALRGLADRGYGVSKTLGMLLLAWLSWIGPSLKLVALSTLVDRALPGAADRRRGGVAWRRRMKLLSAHSSASTPSLLLTEEAIFLVLFLLFLLIRIGNPDLWHPARGGEKPMDFAYLNAVIKSTTFPPYRPVARRRVHELLLLRLRHRRHADQADRHRAVGGLQPGRADPVRPDRRRRVLRSAFSLADGDRAT